MSTTSVILLVFHLLSAMSVPFIDMLINSDKWDENQNQNFLASTAIHYNLSVTLYWDLDIYQCVIFPNKTNQHYYCDIQNTIRSNKTSDTTKYSVTLQYDSPRILVIDSIKVITSSDTWYSMNLFCAPWQYDHFKFSITTKRWNTCKTRLNIDDTNNFKMPQYDNIGIGKSSPITKHTIDFLDNILDHPNQETEGIVSPPKVTAFGIKVADLPKPWDPQTRKPITLSLYWYNTFYQCIVHPIEINQTYLCHVNNTQITTNCDIHKWHYGQYSLFMEKQLNTDALSIDQVIVYDETGTYYGINHFCLDGWEIATSDVCHKDFVKGKCSGYLHTNIDTISPNQYIRCNTTCIDSDNCGRNKLFYHFPYDLYKHNNSFMQAVTANGILHSSGSCDSTHSLHFIHIENKIRKDINHKYIGCYNDEGDEYRAMEYVNSDGTFSGCVKACHSYTYFALQDEDQCFCGNALSNITRHGLYDGSMWDGHERQNCRSDGTYMTGGKWTNAVYIQNGSHFKESGSTEFIDITTNGPLPYWINTTEILEVLNITRESNEDDTRSGVVMEHVEDVLNKIIVVVGALSIMVVLIICGILYVFCRGNSQDNMLMGGSVTSSDTELRITDVDVDYNDPLESDEHPLDLEPEMIDKEDLEQQMDAEYVFVQYNEIDQ